MFERILLITGLIVVLGILGYVNYKSAIMRGKQLYCDVHCKDDNHCDFLENKKYDI